MNGYPLPTAASSDFSADMAHAVHRGPATVGLATPQPMGEINQELYAGEELTDILVSELSALAAVLEPVLMPAPEGKGNQPSNPRGSGVGQRINGINNRVSYAIEVVRNLRNGVAL